MAKIKLPTRTALMCYNDKNVRGHMTLSLVDGESWHSALIRGLRETEKKYPGAIIENFVKLDDP